MRTQAEKNLAELNKEYDLSVKKFNDMHRQAKHLKQSNYKLLRRIEELQKQIAIDKQTGAFAD